MSNTLLATIEHSGTRFVMSAFNVDLGATELGLETPQTPFVYCHLTDDKMPLVRAWREQRLILVTTYREPKEIRASWERRDKDLSQLERQLANYEELLTYNPMVIGPLWGDFHRLPAGFEMFNPLTREQIDEGLRKRPRFNW